MNRAPILIVGCGPGAPEYLTKAARRAIAQADAVLGSRRLIETFAQEMIEAIVADGDPNETIDCIAMLREAGCRRVAVLVSGDPGLYSLAQSVVRRFGADQCAIIPGISSVQVAFARLGLDWADARIVSAHGRTPQVSPEDLLGEGKIALLAGTADALRWSAQLAGVLRESHVAFLCENLTLEDERVRAVTPEELSMAPAVSLAVVLLIEKSRILSKIQ